MAEPVVKQIEQFLIVRSFDQSVLLVLDGTDGDVLGENTDTLTLLDAVVAFANVLVPPNK